ncbi:MAG: hypothetical protein ABIO19_01770 [Burkholderiaceae bacterium]
MKNSITVQGESIANQFDTAFDGRKIPMPEWQKLALQDVHHA